LGQIDKAAIVWTIAIVAVGARFAGFGLQNQDISANNTFIDTTPDEIEFRESLEDYQNDTITSTMVRDQLESVQKMVSSAIMLYDRVGIESFEQFDTNPKFHDGELYVYVVKVDDAIIMAHIDKNLIGKNNYDIFDADGINLGELIINGATEKGSWISYKFKDPENQKILPKDAWVVKHDGFIFGSGIYLQEN